MKVYEYKAFPNPFRVRMALAEKELTDRVEFVQVDVPNGAHKQPEFLAKNPAGTVPLLELDDGTCIAECTAITEYFDHLAGEPTLTGTSAQERAVIHMMQRKVEANLLDAIANYFHHATSGLGFEAYQIPAWGEKQKEQALATIDSLDRLLAHQPYIAGDRFSVADITAVAGFAFGGFCQIAIPETATHLKVWHDRMMKRPSFSA
ncbi:MULTISPECIES: glutathione S-transferase [unclassified Microcoleus]|uniref:glutathione S-transferase family protein n=1 Tax=unclassified Microcoleus TaxID=2642155 RepID=UPI002FD30FAA